MAAVTVAVRVATDDAPIKTHPTFHYRLEELFVAVVMNS